MLQAGSRGIGLSLTVWSNLFRFLADDGVPVRELMASPFGERKWILPMLGCLERWGFISLDSSPAGDRLPTAHRHRRSGQLVREGFGSGRGIRQAWVVRLTDKGHLRACDVDARVRADRATLEGALGRRGRGRSTGVVAAGCRRLDVEPPTRFHPENASPFRPA